MELQKLQRVTVDALEDIKAHDIKVFDTLGQSSEFDRVIVATGNSNRQTRALAWNVVQKVKESGGRVVSVEGTDTGEWVLVDLGDVVVHIMQPTIRQYYGLEELWGAKPVRLKAPVAKQTRASATGDAAEPPTMPAAKTRAKPVAKKKTAKSASSGKTAKKSAKSAADKTVRKTPPKTAPRSMVKSTSKRAPRPAAKKAALSKRTSKTAAATSRVTVRAPQAAAGKAPVAKTQRTAATRAATTGATPRGAKKN